MAKVTGWRVTGEAYRSGTRFPGFGIVHLDDGRQLYVREDQACPKAMLDYAEQLGHNVTEARAQLENWVKTGE